MPKDHAAMTVSRTDAVGNLIFDNELHIMVARVELNEDRSQLSIFINTESMETDHDDGTPEIQVCLNDATLYDREPGKLDTFWTIAVDIREAMQSVVDYSMPDERADFDRSVDEGNDTDSHVYHALYKLDQWLNRTNT